MNSASSTQAPANRSFLVGSAAPFLTVRPRDVRRIEAAIRELAFRQEPVTIASVAKRTGLSSVVIGAALSVVGAAALPGTPAMQRLIATRDARAVIECLLDDAVSRLPVPPAYPQEPARDLVTMKYRSTAYFTEARYSAPSTNTWKVVVPLAALGGVGAGLAAAHFYAMSVTRGSLLGAAVAGAVIALPLIGKGIVYLSHAIGAGRHNRAAAKAELKAKAAFDARFEATEPQRAAQKHDLETWAQATAAVEDSRLDSIDVGAFMPVVNGLKSIADVEIRAAVAETIKPRLKQIITTRAKDLSVDAAATLNAWVDFADASREKAAPEVRLGIGLGHFNPTSTTDRQELKALLDAFAPSERAAVAGMVEQRIATLPAASGTFDRNNTMQMLAMLKLAQLK